MAVYTYEQVLKAFCDQGQKQALAHSIQGRHQGREPLLFCQPKKTRFIAMVRASAS